MADLTTLTAPGKRMRSGELARVTGVSVRALRYYEQQGLLRADRSTGGQRLYEPDAAQRVRMIQQLYAAGLSSKTILDLLPSIEAMSTTSHTREVLQSQRERVEAQIDALVTTRHALDAIIRGAELCALSRSGAEPRVEEDR